jgi:hypothetical protein
MSRLLDNLMSSILRLIPAIIIAASLYGCYELTKAIPGGCWPEWETCD